MSRRRKILLSGTFLFLVGMVLGYFIVLPLLVRRVLASSLQDIGVRDASFSIQHVSLFSTRITGFSASGETSLEEITVGYTPASLVEGRIQEVRVDGLKMLIDLREGKFDLGTLGDVLKRHAEAPTSTTKPDLADVRLPLDRIAIGRSQILLRTPEREISLPFEGVLTQQSDGRLWLQGDIATEPSPVRISGTLVLATGATDLQATGPALELASVANILKHATGLEELSMTGVTSLDVKLVAAEGHSKLTARLEPENALIRVPPALESVTNVRLVKGVFTSEASWRADGGKEITLNAEHVEMRCKELDAELSELSGHFTIAPLIGATQSLKVGALRFAQMQLSDGSASVVVEPDNVIRIDSTKWTWMTGELSTENVRVVPGKPIDFVAVAKDVDLRLTLEAFGNEQARGEGKIKVRLPLRIDWPRMGFARGGIEGDGPGRLQILKASQLADAIAPQLPKSRPDLQERTKREVIQALEDFDYDVLEALLKPEGSTLLADVHLVGRGRKEPRTRLNLQIRLSNLDDLLEFYLRMNSGIGQ